MDQCVFREFERRKKNIHRPTISKENKYKYGLIQEAQTMARTAYDIFCGNNEYVQSSAAKVGLHPFDATKVVRYSAMGFNRDVDSHSNSNSNSTENTIISQINASLSISEPQRKKRRLNTPQNANKQHVDNIHDIFRFGAMATNPDVIKSITNSRKIKEKTKKKTNSNNKPK